MVDFLEVPLLLVEPGFQAEVNRSHNLSRRRFPRHLPYCKKVARLSKMYMFEYLIKTCFPVYFEAKSGDFLQLAQSFGNVLLNYRTFCLIWAKS